MTDNPLLSCRIKIDRARKHLLDLDQAIDALNRDHAHEVIPEDQPDQITRIYRLRVIKRIDYQLAPFIGDAIHNLSSALDALAVSLVKRHPPVSEGVLRVTYFPIKEEGPKFSGADETFFERIGKEAADIIKRVEPYPGGKGELLCGVRYLNRIDKHRAILAVDSPINNTALIGPAAGHGTYYPRPNRAISDGDEVGRWIGTKPNNYPAAQFSFAIVFDEPGLCDGKAVSTFLKESIDLIQAIVDDIEHRVFRADAS
jgi:hypothetical protein